MSGGIQTGIFQVSIRAGYSVDSFWVQVVPDTTQIYELEAFVFWR